MAIHENDQSYDDPEKEAASWARDREEKWWSLSPCERDHIRAIDRAIGRSRYYSDSCFVREPHKPFVPREPILPKRDKEWDSDGQRHLTEIKKKAYCKVYLRPSQCGRDMIENKEGMGLLFGNQNGPKYYYQFLRELIQNDDYFEWYKDSREQIIARAGIHSESDWKTAKEEFFKTGKALTGSHRNGEKYYYRDADRYFADWVKEVDPEEDIRIQKEEDAKKDALKQSLRYFLNQYKEYKERGKVCTKVSESRDSSITYSAWRPDTGKWYHWEDSHRKDPIRGGLVRPHWDSEIDESFFLATM